MSQFSNHIFSPESIASVGVGTGSVERLEVHTGEQSGAHLIVETHQGFTVGNGYDNNVVLRSEQTEPTRFHVDYKRGNRRVQLLEGSASVAGTAMKLEQDVALPDSTSISFGDVAFTIKVMTQDGTTDIGKSQDHHVTPVRNTGALVALVAGIALLGGILVQGSWVKDVDGALPESSLQERLSELGLDNVQLVENEQGILPVVQGRVASQQELNQLKLLKDLTQNAFTLGVQVDSELLDVVRDIYRNHGVAADISVLDVGYIRVETQSADTIALAGIEKALQADVPDLNKIDVVNTPPEIEEDADNTGTFDPGKEVQAVIAGSLSYVITRDQSRYFEGAILPSGHTIKSISEGTVVMLRNGEETQLDF